MKNKWIYGKTVVISGASGGLGFNIAKLLIEKYNCNIIGIARNKEKIENAILTLKENKSKFTYYLFDVSKKENWVDFKNKLVENNIKIDFLINNAGFMLPFTKFHDIPEKDIDDIINTNFVSYVNSIKIMLPLLKESLSPAIVNISSSAGYCAVVGESMYCATKYAVRGLTETLQQEYKKQIYICGVYPGFIKTDILNRSTLTEKDKKYTNKFMMPVSKACNKIVKGIVKKKKKIIMGFDGRYLCSFGRIFPYSTASTINKVLKMSKFEIFDNLYKKEKNK